MQKIDSEVFGKTEMLDSTDPEYAVLTDLIKRFPVSAFGILNRMLNERDYFLTLSKIEAPGIMIPGISG